MARLLASEAVRLRRGQQRAGGGLIFVSDSAVTLPRGVCRCLILKLELTEALELK